MSFFECFVILSVFVPQKKKKLIVVVSFRYKYWGSQLDAGYAGQYLTFSLARQQLVIIRARVVHTIGATYFNKC